MDCVYIRKYINLNRLANDYDDYTDYKKYTIDNIKRTFIPGIELIYGYNGNKAYSDHDDKNSSEEKAFDYLVKILKQLELKNIKKEDRKIFSACRPIISKSGIKSYKASFRIIFFNKWFHCGKCAQIYVYNIFEGSDVDIDFGVYGANTSIKSLRLPFTNKINYDCEFKKEIIEYDSMMEIVDEEQSLIDKSVTNELYSVDDYEFTEDHTRFYVTINTENKPMIKLCDDYLIKLSAKDFKKLSYDIVDDKVIYTPLTHKILKLNKTDAILDNNDDNVIEIKQIIDMIPIKFIDAYESWWTIIFAIIHNSTLHGFNGWEICKYASQKSKYYDEEELGKLYENYKENVNPITINKLIDYAKENEEYKDVRHIKINNMIKDLGNVIKDKLTLIPPFKIVRDIIYTNVICENGSMIKIKTHLNNCSVIDADSNKFLGYIANKLIIEKYINKTMQEPVEAMCNLIDQNNIEITYIDDNKQNKDVYKNPYKNPYLSMFSNNKIVATFKDKSVTKTVNNFIKCASLKMFDVKYNINNITINNKYIYNDDDECRPQLEFITDLIEIYPELKNKFKYCECNILKGIYMCNVNNMWIKASNCEIEKILVETIDKYLSLNKKEYKLIKKKTYVSDLRELLHQEIFDSKFEKKIDSNLDLFAFRNGVIDNGKIREIKPDDYIMTHSDIEYDKNESDKYIGEVKDFFEKLFPIEQERKIISIFLASSLHGHRLDKKFIILTDKRNGNNGKSTLLNLLRYFYNDYLKSSTKFVCKSKIENDNKDSHDAGLQNLKNKRLLLCDELKKNMTLNEGLIKNITGGEYVIEGRCIGKETIFKYIWEANLILIFNEGDCPKFDSTDIAFMNRMIVCPMRSKFVNNEEEMDRESHTFIMDPNISDKFKLWKSALMDYFLEYYNKTGLVNVEIPKEMKDWKNEILDSNNSLSEWLKNNIIKSENLNNILEMKTLYDIYKSEFKMSYKEFLNVGKAWFISKGIDYRSRYRYSNEDKKKHEKTNIVIGVEYGSNIYNEDFV
ncbi:primase/helicase [Adoxophyes honmai entomopoxvirus 'L' virophage 2]|nr:primase/helicase [Adoxophyes honmai entomopoxvirus 'L' virophage 2]